MNSKKFLFLVLVLFSFILVNVSAELRIYMDNFSVDVIAPGDGSNCGRLGNVGDNVYALYDPHYTLERYDGVDGAGYDTECPDWFVIEFDLTNLSTNASGEPTDLFEFEWQLESTAIGSTADARNSHDLYITYDNSDPINEYTFPNRSGDFAYLSTIHYKIEYKADRILNSSGEYQYRTFGFQINYPPLGDGIFISQKNEDIYSLSVRLHDPAYLITPPPAVFHDFDSYLDPITCCWDVNKLPVVPAPVPDPNGVIRCDNNPLYDQNRICYEIKIKDVNALFDGISDPLHPEREYYLKINKVSLQADMNSSWMRTQHKNQGCDGCYYGGTEDAAGQYSGFPPTCDFVHYSGVHIWHTNCGILQSEVPKYSRPLDYIAIPDCPDGVVPGDPEWDGVAPDICGDQDQNVFYNVNQLSYSRYLDPELYKMRAVASSGYIDEVIIPGSYKLARGGGDYILNAMIHYDVYDGSGNIVRSSQYGFPYTNTVLNDRSYDATNAWSRKIIKIGGHDAYIPVVTNTFMPSSPYVRPLIDWTVEVPIINDGFPWNGDTIYDVLFVDVDLITNSLDFLKQTITIGNNNYPESTYSSLDTDKMKTFFVAFPITEGLYHQYLGAATMRAKLYDINGWIYHLTAETKITNARLITVLNPLVYEAYGDQCYTNPYIEKLCWWNYLNYYIPVSSFDLNANQDINFVLRLKNPFDFNEFFDLTYDTNGPANARIDFDPQRNFVAPFTGGRYGYKYALMTLKNPAIIRGDANYNMTTTSVNHPYVWDNVQALFRSVSYNIKIESFDVNADKKCYSLNEDLSFVLVIKNAGDAPVYDLNFLVVSSMDPTIIFHAGDGIDIAPGATQRIEGTLPNFPNRNVFEVQATVESLPFDFDTTDNDKVIYLTVCYEGDLSPLPETNYFALIFIVLIVLFIVVRKK